MSFWIGVAMLAALALALLLLPLRRQWTAADSAAGTDDQLRRLAEFDAEVAAGDIDPAQAAAVRRELERAVVDALPAAASPTPAAGIDALLAACCCAVPALALALYWLLGNPAMAVYSAGHPERDWRQPETSVNYFLERIRARVAAVPDDLDAWAMLARSELQLGHNDAALAAAEQLNRLAPNQPDAMLLLTDALAMHGGAAEHGRARALVAQVLTLEPRNPAAIVMQGMFEQEDGNNSGALAAWQQALTLATEPGLRAEIKVLIAHAGGAVAAAQPRVQVHAVITLDPALAARVRPEDIVFVAARASAGPQVPLAVARHPVADLPLSITLDDSMAMVAGASLADVKEFYLIARISHTGVATASSGDLEGKSPPQAAADGAAITLTIDHVVP